MFRNSTQWFRALKVFLNRSIGRASRENIEAALDDISVKTLFDRQKAHLVGGRRYAQVLRGSKKPSDRIRVLPHGLSGMLDFAIDEWEGPKGKGWELVVYDTDGSSLHIDSDESSDWRWEDPPLVPLGELPVPL